MAPTRSQPRLQPAGRNDRFRVAVVVERYPAVTETFVANDVGALRTAGAVVNVIALEDVETRATGTATCILGWLVRDPLRFAVACRLVLSAAGADIRRACRAIRALGLAARIAHEVGAGGFRLLHAEFINRPALVAALASRLTGVPWSVSVHARDVFVPQFRLGPLVASSRCVAVCSTFAYRHLMAQVPPRYWSKISCVHHGVDLELFTLRAPAGTVPRATGHTPEDSTPRMRVLTVARLVEKKGVETVLRALVRLRRDGWSVQWTLVGDGPQRAMLLQPAADQGLEITHIAVATPEQIHHWMCDADVLALGCTTAKDGDRDGLPNALLEAMASGLPVVTTAGGSVRDAVEHRVTGLIVEPEDDVALADALRELMLDGALRERIARAARALVESRFDGRETGRHLATLLGVTGGAA